MPFQKERDALYKKTTRGVIGKYRLLMLTLSMVYLSSLLEMPTSEDQLNYLLAFGSQFWI